MPLTLSRDIHIPIPRTCMLHYVATGTLQVRQGDEPRLSKWAPCDHKQYGANKPGKKGVRGKERFYISVPKA